MIVFEYKHSHFRGREMHLALPPCYFYVAGGEMLDCSLQVTVAHYCQAKYSITVETLCEENLLYMGSLTFKKRPKVDCK